MTSRKQTAIEDSLRVRCVFCLQSGHILDEQVLWHGETCYLCAPLGQLVEGYLAIVPFRCVGSLSTLSESEMAEIEQARELVEEFYRTFYATNESTFYEQGRGGGGAQFDFSSGFPYHAHLCSLPLEVDIHGHLESRYHIEHMNCLRDLWAMHRVSPYVFVSTRSETQVRKSRAYQARDKTTWKELEQMRLKPVIAEILGCADQANWRVYPGESELKQICQRFGLFRRQRQLFGASEVRRSLTVSG